MATETGRAKKIAPFNLDDSYDQEAIGCIAAVPVR